MRSRPATRLASEFTPGQALVIARPIAPDLRKAMRSQDFREDLF